MRNAGLNINILSRFMQSTFIQYMIGAYKMYGEHTQNMTGM